ncbi:MAG: methyltransferase, partial [Dermatophilaceae bacterium]
MSPPPRADPLLIEALRRDLLAATFTVDGIAARLGPVASAALQREQLVPALLATDGTADPCGILVRFFTLGQPMASGSVERALPSLGLAGAHELGLVQPAIGGHSTSGEGHSTGDRGHSTGDGGHSTGDGGHSTGDGGQVGATCDLRPYADESHDWWVASDLSDVATGQPLATDHVLGIGGASTTLASWTIRRPVGRALDLGTG